MTHFDRFDIVQAHFWYAADYHDGQWSNLYKRLCRIKEYYHPGAIERGPTTDNAKAIYKDLQERNA